MIEEIKETYVSLVYADHNRSRYVQKALSDLLDRQDKNAFILNVGSGSTRFRPTIKNLDIISGKGVDYVGSAENIPFKTASVDLIITQEVFEHIRDPQKALKECHRVLKQGASIFFQVPFIIGYHPGPTDFLRFTKEGIIEILEKTGFKVLQIEITAAGATGFYRIAVEFLAILCSGPIKFLYIPAKGIFSLLLYPIKILDFWFRLSSQRDRIPGRYFAIAKKI